jgi:THO complex subunit 5
MDVSSIYQDLPLHSVEEFAALAPEEDRTEQILQNEHQLMLKRLHFELLERQRYVWHSCSWAYKPS